MSYYEKIIIIDPNLDDSAAEEVINKIKGIITKQGGEILKTDNWGRRKLAYELNKQNKGNYVLLYFQCPPSTINELEKHCRLVDTIVKFMVVKLTRKKQIEAILPAPSPPAEAETDAAKPEEGEAVQTGEASSQEGS
jgi:small subunit ribosomal protein S6